MPSSYALGDQFEKFINRLVKAGRFDSKSEVIRAGLRLLQEHEDERRVKLEELRAAFQAGIDSGSRIPADKVFARLKAKYEKMARERAS
jgi:antitoxin ParD1/3/4